MNVKSTTFRMLLVIACCIVSFVLYLCYRSSVLSIFWHIRYGSTIAFQQHTFTLPLMWRLSKDSQGDGLKMQKAAITGPDTILMIASKTPANAMPSIEAASRWQRDRIVTLNSRLRQEYQLTGEVIHARGTDVFCVRPVKMKSTEGLTCRVVGTDWDVSIYGGGSAQEARELLATIQ